MMQGMNDIKTGSVL